VSSVFPLWIRLDPVRLVSTNQHSPVAEKEIDSEWMRENPADGYGGVFPVQGVCELVDTRLSLVLMALIRRPPGAATWHKNCGVLRKNGGSL